MAKLIKVLFFVPLWFLSPTVANACPACVDSGLFYFYPFVGYWYVLLIFWLLGRIIFNIMARRMNVSLPRLSLAYWMLLFLLSFFLLIPGGLFPLFIFVVLPSWLISYIRCFIQVWKQRQDVALHRRFVVFQWVVLFVFIFTIPASYMIPRKVPYNLRVVERPK